MSSTFEESMFDFDLNFLHHSSNTVNDCRIDKQRKAILLAKKKTIATDSLIKKYYGKKDQLEQTELVLLAAKEECKQVCIDYKDTLEKCAQLEKDLKSLQNENKELLSKCEMAQNQVLAMKSHSHQLQVLVKEHETVIEALKIESQLEKNNVKDYEKNLLNLRKENETLLNDLCLARDIAFGKKKLHNHYKILLQKYEKQKSKHDDATSETSSEENDLFDSAPASPLFDFGSDSENKNGVDKLKPNENEVPVKKDVMRLIEDNDTDNEIVSEDTGRGSSLAFSDGDKCFNSPDYFCNGSNGSPFGTECNKIKEIRVYVDTCTSPITVRETAHIATSPLMFDDEALLSDNNIVGAIETDTNNKEYFITDIPLSTEIVTIKERKKLVDVGTSTVTDFEKVNVSTSPIAFKELDLVHKQITHSATSPIRNVKNDSVSEEIVLNNVHAEELCDNRVNIITEDALTSVKLNNTTVQNLSSQCELEISGKLIKEKTCLEENNSNNLCNENSNDCEIEMILNSMRLTEKLITPIPKTPVNLSKKNDRQLILSPTKKLSGLPKDRAVCPDALKLRHENRVLQTSIADLSKEVMNIKCILKNQLLMPETPKKHVSESKKRHTIDSELFGDSSVESISINHDSNQNSASINKEMSTFPPVEESVVIQEPVMQNKQASSESQSNKDKLAPAAFKCHKSRKKSLESPPVEESIVNEGPVIQNEQTSSESQTRKEKISPTAFKRHKSRKTSLESPMVEESIVFQEPVTKNKQDSSERQKRKEKLSPAAFKNHKSRKTSLESSAVDESVAIQEPVIQNEQASSESQTRKEKLLPPAFKSHKSRKTSLSKEVPLAEINLNSNTSESVPLLESKKTIEDNLRTEDEDEDDDTLLCNIKREYIILNDKKDKNVKCKKLSRLERFRKKLIPKSKIKRINVPICKLRSKAKPIHIAKGRKTDAEILMNNKTAYDKALKVMTELKLNKASDETEDSTTRKVMKLGENDTSERKESINNRIDLRRNSKEIYANVGSIEIKQPVVCLSQLKLSNSGDKEKQQNGIVATSPKKSEKNLLNIESSPTQKVINTRSRSKINQDSVAHIAVSNKKCKNIESTSEESEELSKEYSKPLEGRRRLKRVASDNLPVPECKRVLRSQNVKEMFIDQNNADDSILTTGYNLGPSNNKTHKRRLSEYENENLNELPKDINKSSEECEVSMLNTNIEQTNIEVDCAISHPKESVFCKMLEKYGKKKITFSAKKISDEISNSICKKLEDDIAKIIEIPIDKAKCHMNKLVEDIQHSWKLKNFLAGFMKYLKDPARKRELFNKISSPPAPPMTKSEQVLLYVIRQIEMSQPNTVSMILTQIEFSLFQLNRTPEFDVIESLSHFYALLCRYFGLKNRLRLFLLDAMYCLQFKVVPLVKQCLDVWMHILPLAHMGIAKSPLVTCLVYLLHFYKCEDKFNRIQDIRFILNKKYFYQITDWNETKILEMFKNSLRELRDIKVEKKMLRMAFIILAKRQGPKWCQKNIIRNMLIPMIEKEDVQLRIKQFCVELLGPLLKPYPVDMKVHCEIVVNQLLDMVDQNTPNSMKEAIYTSLIYMNKHNQNRVIQSLLSWSPGHVSSEFEEHMRDFVQEKPLKVWKNILTRIAM